MARHRTPRLLGPALAAVLAAPVAALAAPVEALPPAAPSKVTELAPGVGYQRVVHADGQVVHVIRSARSPRIRLSPAMPGGSPVRRGSLTEAVASRLDAGAVAGINGDFFTTATNDPSGALIVGGDLIHEPEPSRSALVLTQDGGLQAAVLALQGQYQASDPSGALMYPLRTFGGVNRPAKRSSETILYTPSYGAGSTPRGSSRYEARVRFDLPGPLTPNVPRAGTVTATDTGGGFGIPAEGVVVTAVGSAGPALVADLPVGRRVTITPGVTGLPAEALAAAMGGGPQIVRDGAPITSFTEGFTTAQLGSRTSRSAVGQAADGSALLVSSEGPRQGSPGMTAPEQARLLADLGARTAIAMDAGGSAQLSVWDRLVTPWAWPRPLASVLLVAYDGVTIRPLPFRLSPNVDRVDDTATTTVRSTVPGRARVTIVGRSGKPARRIWEARIGPGSADITVDPRRLRLGDGIYLVRARLRPDGGGPATEQQRRVIIDRTLGSLNARPSRARVAVTYRLSRPARVSVRVLSASGRTVKTLRSNRRQRAGRQGVVWNRRMAGEVASGHFRVTVEARTRLGVTGLVRSFTAAPPKKPAGPRP